MTWEKTKNVYSNDAADPAAELSVLLTNMVGSIWGLARPASSKEDGVTQRIVLDYMREVVRSLGASGWYTIGAYSFSGGFAPNSFRMATSRAMIGGFPVVVAGTGMDSETENSIVLPSPPGGGTRHDLVFVEIWLAEVPGSTASNPTSVNKPSTNTLYKYGNRQYGGTHVSDDINEADFEIRRRIQVQYRVRTVAGVDFVTYPNGLNDPTVVAQGGAANPTAIQFAVDPRDSQLFVAGNGSTGHQSTLNAINGLVLALPIASIARSAGVTEIEAGHVTDLRRPNGVANFVQRIGDEMSGNLAIKRASPAFRLIGTEGGAGDYRLIQTEDTLRFQRNFGTELSTDFQSIYRYDQDVVRHSFVGSVLRQITATGISLIEVLTQENNNSARLHLNGRTAGGVTVDTGLRGAHADGGTGQVGTWSNHPFQIRTNDTMRARIAADGRLTNWPVGYESSEQSITTGSVITLAHGLPAMPKQAWVRLRCTSAELGVSTGQEVDPVTNYDDSGGTSHGVTIHCDATNVYVVIGSSVRIQRRSSPVGNIVAITTASWRIIARANP